MICPQCNRPIEYDPYFKAYVCRYCGFTDPPPQTNFDRLRAMSDEELAVFMIRIWNDVYFGENVCLGMCETVKRINDSPCIGCVLEWGRSPYKDG